MKGVYYGLLMMNLFVFIISFSSWADGDGPIALPLLAIVACSLCVYGAHR